MQVKAIARRWLYGAVMSIGLAAGAPPTDAVAQDAGTDPRPAPPRAEGEGPFERLIIRNATVIDGTGAPPRGPVDIVVERNRIVELFAVDAAAGDMRSADRPQDATKEIDAKGMYVLPGFVDLHLHTGDTPKTPDAEYAYKLWMAHGITSGRGVPFASPVFSESEKARSARNEITAPGCSPTACPSMSGSKASRVPSRRGSGCARRRPPASTASSSTHRRPRSWQHSSTKPGN